MVILQIVTSATLHTYNNQYSTICIYHTLFQSYISMYVQIFLHHQFNLVLLLSVLSAISYYNKLLFVVSYHAMHICLNQNITIGSYHIIFKLIFPSTFKHFHYLSKVCKYKQYIIGTNVNQVVPHFVIILNVCTNFFIFYLNLLFVFIAICGNSNIE